MKASQEDVDIVIKILKAQNHYEIFGITALFMESEDSKEKLKKLYRKLSLKVHPDKNLTPNSSAAFQRLNASYEYLTRDTVTVKVQNKVPQDDFSDFVNEFFRQNNYTYTYKNEMPNNYSKPKQKKDGAAKTLCKAKCKDQSPCAKSAKEGSPYCNVHKNYDPTVPPPTKPESKTKVKCSAKNKAGNSCGNSAQDGYPYCKIHHDYDPNAPREEKPVKVKCTAVNGKGNPCANFAQTDSLYCGIHKKFS